MLRVLPGELVNTSRAATYPLCLESRQAEVVPTLYLGALLESEVSFPVLRGMLIMAMLSMEKEFNRESFSSCLQGQLGPEPKTTFS